MRFFDPHIHMTSRTTDDYLAMATAGVAVVVEPAFWLGQPRTHVGTFEDYFASLVGWERFRAAQFGVRHFCALSLNPKEANDPRVADDVIALLPRWLEKESVVAVGEIGFDDQTPAEERYFAMQIEIARQRDLPVLVHTPHRDKKRGTERSLAMVREQRFPEERVLIDHNTEDTLPLVLATGCWAGHSIYPHTKMDEDRMVALRPKVRRRAHPGEQRGRLGRVRCAQSRQDRGPHARRRYRRGDDRADRLEQPRRVLRAVGTLRDGGSGSAAADRSARALAGQLGPARRAASDCPGIVVARSGAANPALAEQRQGKAERRTGGELRLDRQRGEARRPAISGNQHGDDARARAPELDTAVRHATYTVTAAQPAGSAKLPTWTQPTETAAR